jgi:hypothetical protein
MIIRKCSADGDLFFAPTGRSHLSGAAKPFAARFRVTSEPMGLEPAISYLRNRAAPRIVQEFAQEGGRFYSPSDMQHKAADSGVYPR